MRFILLFGFTIAVFCNGNNETSTGHKVTHIVWFEITIGGNYTGRIEIGLFGKIVPITVKNFVNLAKNPRGKGYKGSKIHTVKKTRFIVGGDWVMGDGHNGQSSYKDPQFDDENFKIKHYGAGWVSSAKYKANSNTSLFMISLIRTSQFDGLCVVFGKIIKGMSVLRKISTVPVRPNFKPDTDVIIFDCGAEMADPPFFVAKTDATD